MKISKFLWNKFRCARFTTVGKLYIFMKNFQLENTNIFSAKILFEVHNKAVINEDKLKEIYGCALSELTSPFFFWCACCLLRLSLILKYIHKLILVCASRALEPQFWKYHKKKKNILSVFVPTKCFLRLNWF